MVGRTKPQKNMEPTITGDLYAAEIKFLKDKNVNLAKALSDSKIAYSHIVAERDLVQRELFLLHMQYTKLMNFIKDIDMSARACMNTIVSSSSYITDILQLTNNATVKFKNESSRIISRSPFANNNTDTSPGPHKTGAVKPMIDGHVIFRPTINLRRVNEMSQTELRNGETSPNTNSTENVPSSSRNFDNSISNTNTVSTYRGVHPIIEVETLPESTGNDEELSREYMDEEDNINSSEDMSINNGLNTVNEEEEDDLEETPHDMLGSTNTNSLNMQGNNSQVPLLSGVFRDVRVYLSPMQNTSQCTDPRQHINTERGSGKTTTLSRRSSSLRIPRSSRPSISLMHTSPENRRSLNYESNEDENINNTTNDDSPENSFDSVLQPSLLSSTRISSPKPTHSSVKTSTPNWINALKRHRSSTGLNNTNENSNYEGLNCSSKENQHMLQVENGDRLPLLYSNQRSTSSSINTDYDPLEGPSTLLDTPQNQETPQKTCFLESVGLVSRSSIPSSPTSDSSGPKTRKKRLGKAQQVTQRKITEKGKSIISSKIAKVMLTRMSLSNNTSVSLRRSLDGSSESLQRRLSNRPKRTSNQNNSSSPRLSPPKKLRTVGNDSSPLVKRRTKKSKSKQSEENIRKKRKSSRNGSNNNSAAQQSPQRPVRSRRPLQPVSFKEQSLKKKMRRSK